MNISGLLGSGITNAIVKGGKDAGKKGLTTAISKGAQDALIRAASKELTKDLATKASAQLLPNASGSTLDGILAPKTLSSSLDAVQPKRKTIEDAIGFSTLGDLVKGVGIDETLNAMPKATSNKFVSGIRDTASDINTANMGAADISYKTQLPKIKTSDYVAATGYSGEDIPSYMKNFLSETNGISLGDSQWAETFPQYKDSGNGAFSGTADDIIGEYDRLLNGTANANNMITDENAGMYLALNPDKEQELGQELADALSGRKEIAVTGSQSPAKNVNVSRMQLETPSVSDVSVDANTAQASKQAVDELAGGAGMGGDNNPPVTTAGFAEEGDNGFRSSIKKASDEAEKTANIIIGKPTKATPKQKGVRKLSDSVAKSFNASSKQYQRLVGKSGSIGGYYSSVANRIDANNISPANLAEKAENALGNLENVKQKALAQAEESGAMVDIPPIELTTLQANKLKRAGIDIDNIALTGQATPTQAEMLYRTFRDDGLKLEKSSSGTDQLLGDEYGSIAKEIAKSIDDVVDSNVDMNSYKREIAEAAQNNGEDGNYVRSIVENRNIKFSDIRKDQSDWIAIKDLAGNRLKEPDTFSIAGTEVPNYAKELIGKAKESYWKKRAGDSWKGSNTGGSGNSPVDNGGVKVETGKKKGGLLKDAALIGGGAVLGGLIGGSGGNSNNNQQSSSLNNMIAMNANNQQEDPYSTVTVGGYTYDQLENGYAAAISAGDTAAAKMIASLMEVADNKIERLKESSKSSGLGTALSAVQQLEQLYNQIGDNNLGTLQGKKTSVLNKLTTGGYNPTANNYESMRSGSLGLILKKGLSESGALSDSDIQRAMNLLPSLDTNETAARGQFQQLYQLLKTASSN